MVKSTDVIVIGGGIIGLFSAYMLLRQGAEVVLVDKGYGSATFDWTVS